MARTTIWRYGEGTVDSAGTITATSETTPSGTTTPGALGSTLSVDGSGVVTLSGTSMATYNGFLSDDKKTTVGRFTDGSNYKLMVMQITGQTYTTGNVPDRVSYLHALACGIAASTSPVPFWLHYTATGSSGVWTASDWVSSSTYVTNPGTTWTATIDSTGKVTINANATYHGQVSDDKTFLVGTETTTSTHGDYIYLLTVNT